MSTVEGIFKELEELPTEELIKRCQNWIRALCAPRGSAGSKEWVMHVPAMPTIDPDFLWSECLRRLAQAEKETLISRCKGER